MTKRNDTVRRREEAKVRQAARDLRTNGYQLLVLSERPGASTRERARLHAAIERGKQ